MLRSHGANLPERVEPSSNMLCTSGSKTHVNVVSVSPAAVYLPAQVTTHASPKIKDDQSEPSTVSSSRSALLGQDKALQTG